jgi:hypothetical protein
MIKKEPRSPTAPRSIRASGRLLVVIAVAGAVGVVNAISALAYLPGAEDRLFADPPSGYDTAELNALTGALSFALKTGLALDLLCLLLGGTLAWLVRRGEHQTRVAAWLVCGGIALGQLVEMSADGGQYSEDFAGALLPAWYLPVYFVVQLACLAAAVVVVCLLLTHSARDFYDLHRRSTAADRARIWDTSRVRRVRPDPTDEP